MLSRLYLVIMSFVLLRWYLIDPDAYSTQAVFYGNVGLCKLNSTDITYSLGEANFALRNNFGNKTEGSYFRKSLFKVRSPDVLFTEDSICHDKCTRYTYTDQCFPEGVKIKTKQSFLHYCSGNLVYKVFILCCLCIVLLGEHVLDYKKEKKYNSKWSEGSIDTGCKRTLKGHNTRRFWNDHWKFVIRFHKIPEINITLYPFSINQYVDEIVKERKTSDELMKYEWSRFLSFKTFPTDTVMSPLRLAQAGFYYTGHGQEVKCFCCGMTNRIWTSDETAIQVHQRVSPNCQFIRGDMTTNVSIHGTDYYTDIYGVRRQSGNSGEARFESGASGGPGDTRGLHNGYGDHTAGSDTHINERLKENPAEKSRNDIKQSATNDIASVTQNDQSIKHPDYLDVAARVGSFIHWTQLEIQDPVELAQAGFFYTGVKDFVRCYFCGVGLKHWERGDNPWTEHLRWSTTCGHLSQSRGTENAHNHEIIQTSAQNDTSSTEKNLNEENAGSKATGNAATAVGQSAQSNEVTTDIECVAARSVIEMGYSPDTVREAMRKHVVINGSDPVTSESIILIILESETSTNDQSATPGSHTRENAVAAPTKESKNSKKTNSEKKNKRKQSEEFKWGDARSLMEENQSLKEQMLCKICMDKDVDVVFLPCGHMVACQTCAVSLRKCVICRKLIKGTVRVYQG